MAHHSRRSAAVVVRSIDTGEVLRVDNDRKKVPATVAKFVWSRDGLCCRYCGFWSSENADKFHLDHVHPVARGGDNSPENLVVACRRCNAAKGAQTGWTPLTREQARKVRDVARWQKKQGRRWSYRPDARCLPGGAR